MWIVPCEGTLGVFFLKRLDERSAVISCLKHTPIINKKLKLFINNFPSQEGS